MEVNIDIGNKIHKDYFKLLSTKYGNGIAALNYILDSKKGLDKIIQNKEIIAFSVPKDNSLIAHICLIINSEKEAYFGFFECVDYNVFPFLWKKLIDTAKTKGLKSVFGPVNGSIWHPYRLLSFSNGEDYFPSEPISDIEYFPMFEKLNPDNIIKYHSAYRTDFTPILTATKKALSTIKDNNITVVQAKISKELFVELFEFSKKVFANSPGYSTITQSDFLDLYSNNKISDDKSIVYTALKDGNIVGFCFNIIYNDSLIMKTIAVDAEWQKMGIANAMVHKTHTFAVENNFKKVIYALVRKDNKVKNFTFDKIIELREYSAYQFYI